MKYNLNKFYGKNIINLFYFSGMLLFYHNHHRVRLYIKLKFKPAT